MADTELDDESEEVNEVVLYYRNVFRMLFGEPTAKVDEK